MGAFYLYQKTVKHFIKNKHRKIRKTFFL
jgi:hypothetical protein